MAARRPSAVASQYVDRPSAPTMSRSRVQIATAYSPGTLFTFEGGRGICLAVPVVQPKTLSSARSNMVFDGMTEYVANWFAKIRSTIDAAVDAELCVDQAFIKRGTLDEIQVDRIDAFEPTEPAVMGYEPYPLVFQCMSCGLIYEPESVESLAQVRACRCGAPESWRQVDVVFAHWSGELEPLSPNKYRWNDAEQRVVQLRGCSCGGEEFYLINKSPTFSEWSFRCASCGTSREVFQLSRLTAQTLEPRRNESWRPPLGLDEHMLPVSYRASSLHYVQGGRFIAIDGQQQGSWMELFTPGRQEELLREVAEIHSFSVRQPSWDAIQAALQSAGRVPELEDIQGSRQAIEMLRNAPGMSKAVADMEAGLARRLSEFRAAGVIPGPEVDSPRLSAQLEQQPKWARKRDPIRLTVEHRAFRTEHVEGTTSPPRAVNVLRPDRLLFQGADQPADLSEYQDVVGGLLSSMGVGELYLLRGLPVVEYTFGFSRVSPSPVFERPHASTTRAMPVRLCAFPKMPNGRHPVYVMEQRNEAFYVRLSLPVVRAWLRANGLAVPETTTLGAAYIESYEDFGEFLDAFKTRDAGSTPRTVSNYTYALLHSLSHACIHALADVSGLDVDGIGEHLYPPDLAFVVYRKGMTPDLGNLSSMWRNRSREFLASILSPTRLRCGSGSLCDNRGGACPACIMVPDVGCIAHNQLLSRALLGGGRPPTWDSQSGEPIRGYFEIAADSLS